VPGALDSDCRRALPNAPSTETFLSASVSPPTTPTKPARSRWGAFGYAAFTVIWTASVVSNVGTAMFDTASGWLITSLSADPITVSLVQVAISLPLFLFTLPAGALADVIDSRRLLIIVEIAIFVVSVIFAGLVSFDLATPAVLLATTFLLGVGGALTSPAWGTIIPLLVSNQDLDSATAANSVGFNVGRAIGPALGGIVIATLGIAVPFWVFGASNAGIIAALLWWQTPRRSAANLPSEHLVSALRTGIRHAINNQPLRATLMRVLAFFPFASAYLALLPLVARHQMDQGPQLYGILLGAIGAGAIGGSLALRWLKAELGPDRFVALGSLGTVFALILFGLAQQPITAVCACLLAGASWTIVLTKLYVSAQIALPDWARGRGLAVFLTFIFGATTVGSAVWGKLSAEEGLPITYFVAAVGLVLALPLTWRWKLQTGVGADLSPAMHWRAPKTTWKVADNRGPLLVTADYRVDSKNRAAFLGSIDELGHARKRDGAYAWDIYEAVADSGRFIETFRIESWLELMHVRERITNADKMIEDQIHQLLTEPPRVTFFVSSERPHRSWRKGKNDSSVDRGD
jgi:predicted MFS family arabinose efflux permease